MANCISLLGFVNVHSPLSEYREVSADGFGNAFHCSCQLEVAHFPPKDRPAVLFACRAILPAHKSRRQD
jgi:hypothetical protein